MPIPEIPRGDATWTVIPTATSTTAGLLPTPPPQTLPNSYEVMLDSLSFPPPHPLRADSSTLPNFSYQWLRGDATFASIPFTWNITTGFTQPSASGTVNNVVFTSTTGLKAGMVISTVDSGNVVNTYSVSSVVNGTLANLTNLNMAGNTAAASGVNPGTVKMSGPPIVTASAAGIAPVGLEIQPSSCVQMEHGMSRQAAAFPQPV